MISGLRLREVHETEVAKRTDCLAIRVQQFDVIAVYILEFLPSEGSALGSGWQSVPVLEIGQLGNDGSISKYLPARDVGDSMEQTRLERIVNALLQSDYVKMAFLQAEELCGMARLIELQIDVVANMTEDQTRAHMRGALDRPRK